jgi:hypothetical protein
MQLMVFHVYSGWARIAELVQQLAMGRTIWGSNPGGGKTFHTRPDQPWGPSSLLYNGYWISFPGLKRPGRGINQPPQSSAKVKERLALYLYSPSEPAWPVLGWILPLPYVYQVLVFVQRVTIRGIDSGSHDVTLHKTIILRRLYLC